MNAVFLAGDSTCALKDSKKFPETGWGFFLNEYLSDSWKIENFATNGCSTKSFIDQGRFNAILSILRPDDWVFFQFGHNDQKMENPERFADSKKAYPSNLKIMTSQVLLRGGKVVILSSIARRVFNSDGIIEPTLAPYPETALSLAQELSVPFIDAYTVTKTWLEQIGEKASLSYFMHLLPGEFPAYPTGLKDNTHLRSEGARKVCELIVNEGQRLKLAPFLT